LWSPALAGCGSLEIRGDEGEEARSVIFLVADGMNTGTWTLADYYLQHRSKQRTEWVQLYQQNAVTRALMETCSANSRVTDSAAAASAWSTGVRIDNGAINFAPDGSELEPIHRRVQQSGRSTGLVTTTRVTHATPAAFAANVKVRGEEDTIARQYLEREVDVLLGGGEKNFSALTRADGVDLKQQYQAAGYQLLQSRDQLLNMGEERAKRLLGLFWPSHLPYSIDRNQQPEIAQQVPTLAEMMRRALSTLEQNRHGFLLQVEGGRVDHGGHGNDVGAIVHDQLAFDECIAVAREYSQQHPETLVIVTTDHGCGGCQLNGVGSGYRDTDQTFFSGSMPSVPAMSTCSRWCHRWMPISSRRWCSSVCRSRSMINDNNNWWSPEPRVVTRWPIYFAPGTALMRAPGSTGPAEITPGNLSNCAHGDRGAQPSVNGSVTPISIR